MGDVFVVTKRWMADTQIQRAICILPGSKATEIRTGFQPPSGVAPRRAIKEGVRKNLQKTVPPCRKTGEISHEGERYLLEWSRGILPRVPGPTQYSS